ncbi:MAG: rhodanese-like domain-containing protein [Bacteroidales bacterium]|nr:rhodanese-like domain-containing protein [Bacteroidales bacterium]
MNEQLNFYQLKLQYETDAWDVFNGLQNGEKIILVDARSSEAYEMEHIPGAINIPHRTISEQTTKSLNNAYIYVTYCDGIGCNASTKAALHLTKLGFKVKELQGGLDWWKRDGYSTDGTKAKSGKEIVCGC